MGKLKSKKKAAALDETAALKSSTAAASYVIQEQSFDDSLVVSQSRSKCCTKQCWLRYLRKILTFLISRVGLMILVVGYVVAGGFTIEALEADYEKQALKLSDRVLEQMLQRIYRQIENNSTRVRDYGFYAFLRSEIRTFSDFYTNATLNGTLTGHVEPQWDFFGSVFYCVTLISTIGYGHITCKTKMGKVFTIVYSAIGIPLMMLFLANIGSSTATLFKFIYRRSNQCRRGLRGGFFRGTRTELLDEYQLDDQELDYDPADPMAGDVDYNDVDFETNKEAFYRDTAIFGGPPSSLPPAMGRENESSSTTTNSSRRRRPEFVTLKIGLRDVEIERGHVEKFLSDFRIPVWGAGPAKWPTPQVQTVVERKRSSNSSNPGPGNTRLAEAIKKMDTLLSGDQDSLTGGPETISVKMEKRVESAPRSLDKTLNSLDEYNHPNTPSSPGKNIKFHINSDDDEDDDMIILGEYANMNFDDEPEPNQDFLLASIFDKPRASGKKTSQVPPKPSPINVPGVTAQVKQETTPIVPATPTDSSSTREQRTRKQTEFAEPVQKAHRIKATTLSSKKSAGTSSNARKLISVYSAPGFSSELLRRNQTSMTSRSVYSYDYPPSQDDSKRRVRRVSKVIPFYNEKQLKLIYQQYREQKRDKMGIPMLWTAIIMPGYLFAGMLLFSSFEDWRPLDALYFCFTTLTTIGFGDFIPTRSTLLKRNGNKNNLYISALYIFLGLILIAMCINLVKNQLKKKIKSFARKIGLSNC